MGEIKFYIQYFLVLMILQGCQKKEQLADYVNPLQGTLSSFELSKGNTYPAIALPWGMNFWTPQTGPNGNGWQYKYQDTIIRAFKQTHQPSPWINDYGCFSIMPFSGNSALTVKNRGSRFNHDMEISKPYYYSVYLEDYEIKTEITPTKRGAIFRISYPQDKDNYLIIDGFPKGSMVSIDSLKNRILGYSRFYAPNNKASLPANFASYWVIQLPEKPERFGCWDRNNLFPAKISHKGEHVGAYIQFNSSKETKREIKVASSFISIDQAIINLEQEIGSKNFEEVKDEAFETWNNLLRKIKIHGSSEEQKRTFYSALYRIYLFPREFHEYDKSGRIIHYSPLNGEVFEGPLFTDNGLWDTFRAVHPFYTIIKPSFTNSFIESLLNYYLEGGWLPEWFSPGYKDCMIGQHSSSVIIDAYMKGIRNWNPELAWEAIIKGANNEGPVEALGRDGIAYYDQYGYIPYDVGITESVSKTLEYAYNDFCIYTFGKSLGKPITELEKYLKRSMNYKNIIDTITNFPRPKDHLGNWKTPFYPDNWGHSFTEGSSWHWIWSVFHDIEGLMNLMGGKAAMEAKLDSMLSADPTFRRDWDNKVIHEMTEMVLGGMGQYAHGNQPSQHALYLYNYAGASYKSQRQVRYVLDNLYHSGPDGLCGDEDNGQTSAWYVMSALGFYPVTPGSSEFIFGTPLFKKVDIQLENGNTFTISAPNNSSENYYIQKVFLNGNELHRYYIRYDEIMNGGILEFDMGPEPNYNLWKNVDDEPFSMSSYLRANNKLVNILSLK